MKVNSLEQIKEILLKNNNFLILTHTKPDGDALGSTYALLKFLNTYNKKAVIGLEEDIISKYDSFFPTEDKKIYFKNYDQINKNNTIYDYILILDTSSYSLLGLYKKLVLSFDPHKVLIIDHHILREKLEVNYYIDQVTSTSELIIDLIGIDNLDFNMAQALYMGIVYDTGQFRHSSTSADIFLKISRILRKHHINLEEVYYRLFENESIERKLLSTYLVKNMVFFANGKISVCYLGIEIIENLKRENIFLTENDMVDLVSIPHSIRGVEVSVMIRQKHNQTTLSLRSRNEFNVSDFISTFGGGGHKKAAGLKFDTSYSFEYIKEHILIPLEKEFLHYDSL